MMSLDIIIPAFNEEDRIGRTLDVYRTVCAGAEIGFVVALDGCDDGTAAIVAEHASLDPRVRLIEFPKLGKGGVLMEAIRRCSADWIGFVDADCATPPAEFLRLVEVAASGDCDVVIATRRHPTAVLPVRRSLARRATSVGFAFGTRHLFRLPVLDTQCGAKVMRRVVAERAIPLMSSRDFLFDVDLLVTSRALGFGLTEVPTVWIDCAGSRVKPLADARRMMASSLRLWLHHRTLPVVAVATQETKQQPPMHASQETIPDASLLVPGGPV
jgi:glycosyltransferase involved in cell wall biosynthesis